MKLFRILSVTLFVFIQLSAHSQVKKAGPWSIGIGFNFVDNDGYPFSRLLKAKEGWSGLPFPNTITVGYKYNKRVSFEFSESMNSFKSGTIINQSVLKVNQFFNNTNLNGKFHFNSLENKMTWFDPYASVGGGMTCIGKVVSFYPTVGLGSNFWVTKHLGVNVQSMANFRVSNTNSSFLIHMLTFKYSY